MNKYYDKNLKYFYFKNIYEYPWIFKNPQVSV